jgi:antitoxin CptB
VTTDTLAASVPLSAEQLRRLRWNCRRGLLENDLVLEKFLGIYARDLDQTRLACLNELLALTDNDLWDVVAGRVEPAAEHVELVGWLRSC